jgi:hypothetical protein
MHTLGSVVTNDQLDNDIAHASATSVSSQLSRCTGAHHGVAVHEAVDSGDGGMLHESLGNGGKLAVEAPTGNLLSSQIVKCGVGRFGGTIDCAHVQASTSESNAVYATIARVRVVVMGNSLLQERFGPAGTAEFNSTSCLNTINLGRPDERKNIVVTVGSATVEDIAG